MTESQVPEMGDLGGWQENAGFRGLKNKLKGTEDRNAIY